MQNATMLAACICLTAVLLLNAGCGLLSEERRVVKVPARPDHLPLGNYSSLFEGEVKRAHVSDWKPAAVCSVEASKQGNAVAQAVNRHCKPYGNEDLYKANILAALENGKGFHVVFTNWNDSPLWINLILLVIALLPSPIGMVVTRDSCSVQSRACAVQALRMLVYFSLFQPIQLAVSVAPLGLLWDFYVDRLPVLIFVLPGIIGIPLDKAAWLLPATQTTLSCYTLVVINKYARTFIPGLSFRELLARDTHPNGGDDEGEMLQGWTGLHSAGDQDRAFERMLAEVSRGPGARSGAEAA